MDGPVGPAPTDDRPAPYGGAMELVSDMLACLDEGLGRALGAARAAGRETEDASLRGLVITENEVLRHLASRPGAPAGPSLASGPEASLSGTLWGRVGPRLAAARRAGRMLPLDIVRERFRLSLFETECLMVCLAAELDAKYEKVFGYLNDDVTRKSPSIQLLLSLFAPAEHPRLFWRRCLTPEAPLLRNALLTWSEDAQAPPAVSHLGRCPRVDEGVVRFLLDEGKVDPELEKVWHSAPYPPQAAELWRMRPRPAPLGGALEAYFGGRWPPGDRLIVTLVGRPGSGRRALVETECAARGLGLLPLDCRRLVRHAQPEPLLTRAFRDSILRGAPLLLANADAVADDRERGPDLARLLDRFMEERGWLAFMTVEDATSTRGWFARHRVLEVPVAAPTGAERAALWRRLLAAASSPRPDEGDGLAETLAAKFQLTPGQISEAFHRAASDPLAPADPGRWREALHRHAARVSAPRLGELAQRLTPVYGWNDIVLPSRKRELLQDIVRRVRHRPCVMDDWRFGQAMSRGRGLHALFSGPPGTGKTMAAEVIAAELEMDGYRIDLSSVVSKYIGETEKNLARIFREAEHANVILFFDEADALFGKRSEIKDAHDRYANIEINYLLQQMEAYDGVVILATNLRQNLDEAFLRRIQIVVEFPVPSPEDRARIWQKSFPPAAPLGADVDVTFLARNFDLA
ncbi:MAG: ATP-binding protein, partial [Candidatus Rokuibacteriota bacterium]